MWPEPTIAAEDREPPLSVAAVARRFGVAPATLRTWDRRYGMGPSGHTTGRHRRYAAQDIATLELMQRALLRGASPAEAARYALAARGEVDHMVVADGDGRPYQRPRANAGVRGLRLPGASQPARGLGRAILTMDSIAAGRRLDDTIAVLGVARAWDEVVRPVVCAVAQRLAHSGLGVELERLLYESVLAALIRATPVVAAPRNPRPVLLACVPCERHGLPLYGLVAALAAREIGTRMLGAALPAEALNSAMRRTAPAAVVLWAQLPHCADPLVLDGLPKTRQRSRLFLGGPGWQGIGAGQHHMLAQGLGAACDEIERVVLGGD